jgi:hypothetical protein
MMTTTIAGQDGVVLPGPQLGQPHGQPAAHGTMMIMMARTDLRSDKASLIATMSALVRVALLRSAQEVAAPLNDA